MYLILICTFLVIKYTCLLYLDKVLYNYNDICIMYLRIYKWSRETNFVVFIFYQGYAVYGVSSFNHKYRPVFCDLLLQCFISFIRSATFTNVDLSLMGEEG